MAATTAAPEGATTEWTARQGPAAGVEGLAGCVRLIVADVPVGVLKIDDGAVEIIPDGEASAAIRVDAQSTLEQLLGGDLHPVVAWLQGRLRYEGDVRFTLQALLGLQAGSPWSSSHRS
jgi:hypothetical protein